MSRTAPDSNTLERVVPDEMEDAGATGRATLGLHLERYQFAALHGRPGRILDIACGVGYGTRLLAEQTEGAVEVIGVDLSADAVDYANRRYGLPNMRFVQSDAIKFHDDQRFDTIVSLETVEHLADPRRFMEHLLSLLKPNGILVASVPTTPSVDANPNHLNDFTEKSFRALGRMNKFREINCLRQTQPFDPIAILKGTEKRAAGVRRNLPRFYLANPAKLLRRGWATVRYGFQNRYITIAWSS